PDPPYNGDREHTRFGADRASIGSEMKRVGRNREAYCAVEAMLINAGLKWRIALRYFTLRSVLRPCMSPLGSTSCSTCRRGAKWQGAHVEYRKLSWIDQILNYLKNMWLRCLCGPVMTWIRDQGWAI